MVTKRSRAVAVGLAALALGLPGAAAASAPKGGGGGEAALLKALLRSRELWSTIDLCNPPDQREYVGIRGSMPGDKRRGDKMYMAFRLQYLNAADNKWVDLASARSAAWVYVGPGGSVRQGGRSFQLVPRAGMPAATMRGVVSYQWRRGSRVLQSVSRPTTAGHKSLAGADPAGYSAATCVIGRAR